MSERISAGVLDEGVAIAGAVLDFVGAGVTVTASANKQTVSIPGGGGVSAVTATSPIASSGGTTPDISLSGIVDVVKGGTGVNTFNEGDVLTGGGGGGGGDPLIGIPPTAAGQVLTSNGTFTSPTFQPRPALTGDVTAPAGSNVTTSIGAAMFLSLAFGAI